MSEFCKRFNTSFSESGLSQSELARRAKLNRMEVSNYLKGRYKPKEDKLERLAKALHVNSDWLAGANVDQSGNQTVDFLTNDNIYLDDQPLTTEERQQLAIFARALRKANNTKEEN